MPNNKVKEEVAEAPSYEYNMNLTPSICNIDGNFRGDIVASGTIAYRNLSTWFGNFHDYRDNIRNACWRVYYSNGIIRSAVDRSVALPTLDRTVQTKDRKSTKNKEAGKVEYVLPTNYHRNKKKFSAVLDKIRDRDMQRDMLLKLHLDGMAAYYFQTDQQYPKDKYLNPLWLSLCYELNNQQVDDIDKNFEDLSKQKRKKIIDRILSNELSAKTLIDKIDVSENSDKIMNEIKSNFNLDYVEMNESVPGIKNCTLQSLPIDWIRVIGFRNNSLCIAFDLNYFLCHNYYDMLGRLLQWPEEIRKGWRDWQSGRIKTPWLILDTTKTIVVKTGSISSPVCLPLVAGTLEWVNYANMFTNAKRNMISNDINSSLVYQKFPGDGNSNKSTLTQDQQAAQHEKVKTVLNTPNVNDNVIRRLVSLAPGTDLGKLDFSTNLFNKDNETTLPENTVGAMGVGLGLLTGNSGTYASLRLNIDVLMADMHRYIEQFEWELNKVINANIINDPKCYMEVKYGYDSYVSRSESVSNNLDLYRNAGGSLEALISSTGNDFESYQALMEDAKEMDYSMRYRPHATSFTLSEQERTVNVDKIEETVNVPEGGRPSLLDSEITENPTITTRGNDANNMPKQST